MTALCPSTKKSNCLPRIVSVDIYGVLTLWFPYPIKVIEQRYYGEVSESLSVKYVQN
jgi:hypothetical protein